MIQWKECSNASAFLYLLMLALTGCARATYQYGLPKRPVTTHTDSERNQLTFGGEHPRLDQAERFIYYPFEKLKEWFPDDESVVDPQEQRAQAIEKAQEYLVLNGLTDINIDIREYDPATQWRRLRDNKDIHPFWKYTSGSVSHLTYVLFPARVFRVDRFDPYTKTLSLNSSDPSMALYRAADAKVIFNRRYPGMYMAVRRVPLVGLSKDICVANDVLSYARNRGDWATEEELTIQVYSDFGADVVFEALPLVPRSDEFPFYVVPLISIGGSVVGEVIGHAVLSRREQEQMQHEAAEKEPNHER